MSFICILEAETLSHMKIQKPCSDLLDIFSHYTFTLEEAELSMNCSTDGSQLACLQK